MTTLGFQCITQEIKHRLKKDNLSSLISKQHTSYLQYKQ